MDAMRLRSRGDRDLADKLLQEPLVKKVRERLEKEEEKTPRGIRRQLLASSLRLTASMMPDVHRVVQQCRDTLAIDIPLELYVYPSGHFNAACIKPEAGRLFIMVSSSLLEAFPEAERRFVIGHELGHHLYGHHDIPIGHVLDGGEPTPDLALRLCAWARYAEISADRAGAACADDPDAVGRSLFRLASGLTGSLATVRIDDFAAQVDDLQVERGEHGRSDKPRADWFSTHPFSPLRLKAVRHFFESELSKEGGGPVPQLEARVQTLMALMEPSYLEEKSDDAETARRLLFAGAIAVADATDGVSDEEIAAIEKLFGEGAFSDKLDLEALTGSLDSRIADANENVSHARRIQVLRDLCVIARADGHVSTAERDVIEGIARGLEVPVEIVDETLCGSCDLD
jgi:Zn-dependent protease with chaperone function/tellurite resistance protein